MSSGFLIYADNEPKSVPARDLGDCRDNLRNSRSVFLIVFSIARPENNAKKAVLQSANCKEQIEGVPGYDEICDAVIHALRC